MRLGESLIAVLVLASCLGAQCHMEKFGAPARMKPQR